MKYLYKLLAIIFLCSAVWVNFSVNLYAQKNKIKFEHLSIEQGLSHTQSTSPDSLCRDGAFSLR